jgi:hypothetical protein
MARARLNRTLFLKCARVMALGGLALLVLVIFLGHLLFDEHTVVPFVGVAVGIFFTGVAAYALALALNQEFSGFETDTADETWERVPEHVADTYQTAEDSFLSAQLGLWAAVIFGFVLAVAGAALFGDLGGYAGFALGALCILIAVAILVRTFSRMVRARAEVWAHLGRHRWQLGLYLLGCVVLAILWIQARRWLHTTNLGLLDGSFIAFAMMGLRSMWRNLW